MLKYTPLYPGAYGSAAGWGKYGSPLHSPRSHPAWNLYFEFFVVVAIKALYNLCLFIFTLVLFGSHAACWPFSNLRSDEPGGIIVVQRKETVLFKVFRNVGRLFEKSRVRLCASYKGIVCCLPLSYIRYRKLNLLLLPNGASWINIWEPRLKKKNIYCF
jgi:hypothetical protein